MHVVGKIEELLLVGFFGFLILLYVAFAHPGALNDVNLGDLSAIGLTVKLGAVLAIGGLLAFFHGLPGSLISTARNICRLVYAVGFAVVSWCSSNDWQCFVG